MTFEVLFLRNEKWYLDSFGIAEEDAMDVAHEVWKRERRHGGCDGVKVQPTSEILKTIQPVEA